MLPIDYKYVYPNHLHNIIPGINLYIDVTPCTIIAIFNALSTQPIIVGHTHS